MRIEFAWKRTVSLLIILLMTLTLFSGSVSAITAGPSITQKPHPHQATMPTENVSKSIDWKAVTQTLYKAISSQSDKVDVSKYKIPSTGENYDYFYDLLFTSPKFFRFVKSASNYSSNGIITNVLLEYRFSKSDFEMATKTTNAVVTKIISDIKDNPNISLEEKILLVHDRISSLCEYDLINKNKGVSLFL